MYILLLLSAISSFSRNFWFDLERKGQNSSLVAQKQFWDSVKAVFPERVSQHTSIQSAELLQRHPSQRRNKHRSRPEMTILNIEPEEEENDDIKSGNT